MDIEQPDPPSILLFVSDALRYDYGKQYFSDLPGTFCKGVAQGPGTPWSFPTIVSGLHPDKHGIEQFNDPPISQPTIFDVQEMLSEYDVAYFDHPQDPTVRLLNYPPVKQLSEVEPPFVYIERELATHTPYGRNWWRALTDDDITDPIDVAPRIGVGAHEHLNPRVYPDFEGSTDKDWDSGLDYIQLMKRGQVDFKQDYKKGCELARERFLDHVDYLDEQGWLDDTFIVMTSDHGEIWGHHDGKPAHWIHNTITTEVMEVPMLFYDRAVDVDPPVPLMDLLETWWPSWPEVREQIEVQEKDEVDITDEQAAKERLRDLGYL